jgi:hypothetical protein
MVLGVREQALGDINLGFWGVICICWEDWIYILGNYNKYPFSKR